MRRDFVIQLRPNTDLGDGKFEGRVEHIDSGRSAHFQSVEEFLAFVARSLALETARAGNNSDGGENLTSL